MLQGKDKLLTQYVFFNMHFRIYSNMFKNILEETRYGWRQNSLKLQTNFTFNTKSDDTNTFDDLLLF